MSGITMITSVLIEMLAKVWQVNYFIQEESIFIRNFVSMEKIHDHHFSIMSILNFSRKAIGWKKKTYMITWKYHWGGHNWEGERQNKDKKVKYEMNRKLGQY